MTFVADKLIGECAERTFDLIALPGGMPGATNLRNCSVLIQMLKKQKETNRWYAAICASPAVVFQPHGLLEDHQKATCYPATKFADVLGAQRSDKRVVVSGKCITSQGPGTAMEFSVVLVECLLGLKAAQVVEAPLLMASIASAQY